MANCLLCSVASLCHVCATGELDYLSCPSTQAENCEELNTDDFKCDKCEDGFYLNTDQLCEPCGNIFSECTECSDSTTCTGCESGVV